MSNLLTPNPVYKPFRYPWAYEAWLTQNRIHWLPEEVPLAEDVKDWKKKLTDSERNLLTQIFRFFTQADIEVQNCLKEGTKILTPTGWVDFKKLTKDDLVAQVNDDRTVEFVKPTEIIKQKYTGLMSNLTTKTNSFQLSVTDNHRMVYSTYKKREELFVSEMNNVIVNSNYFHHTAAPKKDGTENNLSVFEKIYIAYQADGAYNSVNRNIRFEFKKERKILKLISYLKETNLDYSVIKDEKRNTTRIYVTMPEAPNHDDLKNFSWLNLENKSVSWFKEFIDEISHWDGYFTKNIISYSSINPLAIDKILACAALAGYRTRCKYFDKTHKKNGRKGYSVNIYSKYNPTCGNAINVNKKFVENENVYCVSVPSGKILVNYNNTISITGNCYNKHYSRVFQPTEVQMMLGAFSAMESIHIAAYSHLLDTIGMPEVEYSAFLHYKEMKDKYDYMQGFNINDNHNIAKTLAVFGAFTEGLQLFASFAMLMNFSRFNKMKGMGQIVTWSVRDETLHCQNIIKLFRTFVHENPEIWTEKLREELLEACITIVEHEDAFIDLAFEMGEIEGLNAQGVKDYIRYIADRRLEQLGLDKYYGINKNPLPWMDAILNGVEHTNFFENRATEYSRASTQGDWEEAFTEDERNFVVYSKDNCPYCVKTKEFFNRTGYAYRVEDKSDDTERNEWYDSRGFVGKERTVPKIYEIIDGKEVLLGGSEILNNLLK